MPSALALILTLVFIAFLFYRDSKEQWIPSPALVIPCIWLFIRGSRSVTEWAGLVFNVGPPPTGEDILDGTPLDRAVLFLLMAAGLTVLFNRGISWAKVFRNNLWLILFFLYCAISTTWSDFPFIAMKRWFKAFGDPIMVLIILTDRDPLKAVDIVLRTTANCLVPLSVLFIKYYPNLGRGYSVWTGEPVYTGVTTNKNLLGFVLIVCGLSLVWRLYKRWNSESGTKVDNLWIPLILLLMVFWLFDKADSKTSLICFLFGVAMFFALGLSNVRKHIFAYFMVGGLAFIILQVTMDITGLIIAKAGRDGTLTGRTELWAVLSTMQQHPTFGFGYESFWLGERLQLLQSMWFFRPNQAHSGYFEIYLNLGWVGCCFLLGVVISCFGKLRKHLVNGSPTDEWVVFGRLGMAYLCVYLLYNYTEAAFKSPHLLFFVFVIFAIGYIPQRALRKTAVASTFRDPRSAQAARLRMHYTVR